MDNKQPMMMINALFHLPLTYTPFTSHIHSHQNTKQCVYILLHGMLGKTTSILIFSLLPLVVSTNRSSASLGVRQSCSSYKKSIAIITTVTRVTAKVKVACYKNLISLFNVICPVYSFQVQVTSLSSKAAPISNFKNFCGLNTKGFLIFKVIYKIPASTTLNFGGDFNDEVVHLNTQELFIMKYELRFCHIYSYSQYVSCKRRSYKLNYIMQTLHGAHLLLLKKSSLGSPPESLGKHPISEASRTLSESS